MTEQLALGLARASDPQTSHEAARSITGRTERCILELFTPEGRRYWLNEHDVGLTGDDIADILGIYPPTVKSALSRLKNHKLIEACGTRPSARGLPSTVWRLAPSSRNKQ